MREDATLSVVGEADPVAAVGARVETRVVHSPALIEELCRQRHATFARHGLRLRDGALDALRRFATNVALFVDGRPVGAFAAWRLSEAPCSLGYTLAGCDIQRHPPDRVVELGSMFLLPEFAGRGLARGLMEAGRVLVAGMRPELLVGFAVRGAVADRYVNQFGFRPVGPFLEHPLAPGVEVVPLLITWDEFAHIHFA